MEITASEMKKSIERIYKRLDKVTPVDFDCGKLCGEVCCVYDAEDYRNEELALYNQYLKDKYQYKLGISKYSHHIKNK